MKVSRGTFVSVADLRALFLGASFRIIERLEQSLDGAIYNLASALSGFGHSIESLAIDEDHVSDHAAHEASGKRQKHNQQYPSGHVVLPMWRDA